MRNLLLLLLAMVFLNHSVMAQEDPEALEQNSLPEAPAPVEPVQPLNPDMSADSAEDGWVPSPQIPSESEVMPESQGMDPGEYREEAGEDPIPQGE